MKKGSKKITAKTTFYELVDSATHAILLALIEDGGTGMKREVYDWLGKTVAWRTELEKLERKNHENIDTHNRS